MKNPWLGVVLIGDGLLGLAWPRRYLRLLKIGPQSLKEVLESLAEQPQLTRALCLGEIALGIWFMTASDANSEQMLKKFKELGASI